MDFVLNAWGYSTCMMKPAMPLNLENTEWGTIAYYF